jgi:hypothetical protein
MVLSQQERVAQRRIVGTVRACGVLTGGGLAMWRECNAGEWKASAAEIGEYLVVLEVPHRVVRAYRPPLAKSWSNRPRRGEEIRIAREDLKHMVRWMPSLQEALDRLQADAPGVDLVFFEPNDKGMAVMKTSALAAGWQRWTVKQATAMGLMCAECGLDLRQHSGDDDYQPYNIPRPGWPGLLRLVCGRCCNHGLDEMERLITRQPA